MLAALIALLLTIATQAGADDAKLNPDEWTFLECKHAEGALFEIVTGENASLPLVLAISKDESSLIEMQNDWYFNDCRGWRHSFLECSDKKMAKRKYRSTDIRALWASLGMVGLNCIFAKNWKHRYFNPHKTPASAFAITAKCYNMPPSGIRERNATGDIIHQAK